MNLRPIESRGLFDQHLRVYGKTISGTELEVWLPDAENETDLLLIAGIHGDEPEGTVLLSSALRSINRSDLKCAVILCANPDGLKKGTRGNLRGVDLNRNFSTKDWRLESLHYKWFLEDQRKVIISPGDSPQSEPETRGLLSLFSDLNPCTVVSLHAPAACIDDPNDSEVGRWLSARTGLPHVRDMGLPTPGSLGTWGLENDINIITWELPDLSISQLRKQYEQSTIDLLRQAF